MIIGVGTDIVAVARMRRNLQRHGERFARRILAEEELAELDRDVHPARFLAKRFAAKEAAVKALGTGFRRGIGPRHIAVGHDPAGRPLLRYHGPARQRCEELGVAHSHISLADEHDYAVAFVTLTGD